MNRNEEIVDHVRSIPPLSQSAMRIMKIMRQAEYSLVDISHVVEFDAALTANVLKVVNAPSFGLGNPVNSVTRAVTFLGDKTVAGIALASCSPYVYDRPLNGYEAERGELWGHSLFAAIAAREISFAAKKPLSAETAYTGALVHDIGKAVLTIFFEGRAREILLSIDTNGTMDFASMERQVFGITMRKSARLWPGIGTCPRNLPIASVTTTNQATRLPNSNLWFLPCIWQTCSPCSASGHGARILSNTRWTPPGKDYFNLSQEDVESIMLDTAMEYERLRTLFISN